MQCPYGVIQLENSHILGLESIMMLLCKRAKIVCRIGSKRIAAAARGIVRQSIAGACACNSCIRSEKYRDVREALRANIGELVG